MLEAGDHPPARAGGFYERVAISPRGTAFIKARSASDYPPARAGGFYERVAISPRGTGFIKTRSASDGVWQPLPLLDQFFSIQADA